MKLFQKMKGKLGFTLAELLVVIGILTVVLAVAVPNTAAYVKSIKLTELDDSARSIYMAAQNRLDDLKAVGTDMNFEGAELTDGLTCFENAPDTLKYITYTPGSNDDFMKLSVVESQLDDNYYIIEYDPETGIAYSAFYAEKTNYDNEAEFVNAYKELKRAEDREFSHRLSIGGTIGYYGATVAVVPVESSELPMPVVEVFNREKMGIKITAPAVDVNKYAKYDRAYFSVKIGSIDIVSKGTTADSSSYINPGDTITIILDTLGKQSGSHDSASSGAVNYVIEKQFSDWADASISAGSDITIEVEFFDPKGVAISTSRKVTVNSLFADGSNTTTANVEYGRHLENLTKVPTITTVEINRDIDFSDDSDDYFGWNNNITYKSRYAFKTVENTNIKTVNGNNHKIKYAQVDDGAGLFDTLNGAAVSNLSLINTKVTNNSGNAGALAGTMSGGNVANVEVYVEGADWSNPATDPHAKFAIKGSSNVGGLVGEANGTAIKSSYASVKVVGGQNAGGLVGSTNGLTLENAYSGGHTKGGKYELDDGTTLVNVSASQNAGGIIGSVNGTVNVSGIVYSTCSVKGGNGSDTAFGGSGNVVADGAVCYAAGYNYSSGSAEKASSRENIKSGADYKLDTPNVNAARYDQLLGSKYPYQGVGGIHRGDWVSDDEPIPVFGFFYWEIENGDPHISVIYYDVDADAIKDNHDLCDREDAVAITEYGYGYFYTGSAEPTLNPSNEFDNSNRVKYTGSADFAGRVQSLVGTTESITAAAYYNKDAKAVSNKSNNKLTISVGEKSVTVTYNPDFYAMTEGNGSLGGSESTAYEVRTVAQLQHVDSYLASGLYFKQSHDLKGGTITPIGKDTNTPFKGSYNGQSYRIIELNIDGSGRQYVGIFGVTEDAILKNIILFAPASETANSGSYVLGGTANAHYIGGIVGYAKVAETKTASLPNGALIGLSAGTDAGLKVNSLGVSSGKAKVVSAYNAIYAKTAALGASSGAKVVALSDGGNHSVNWAYDNEYHWGSCTNSHLGCYEYIREKHTFDENLTCTVCGAKHTHTTYNWNTEKDATSHWSICRICGEQFGVEKHIPNGVSNPQAGQTYQCGVCWANFQYSSCDVHDYSAEWKSDGNNHWHECTVCGDKTDIESHTLGNYTNNGDNHTAACTACGNTVTQSHSVQGDYTCTSKQHSYTCACGAPVSESHTAGNWITDKQATADEDGHRHKECTVCKYVMQEETIPAGRQPNDCIYCGSSNTQKMGPWDDEGHTMRCNDCGKEFKAVHTISLTKSDGDGSTTIARLGTYDSNLGHNVTLEDVDAMLKKVHKHYCMYCDYKEYLPLSLDNIQMKSEGETNHRFLCPYCGQSVMQQAHELREWREDYDGPCDLCSGNYKKRNPDDSVRGLIENCAVAGYTLKDSTSSGNTFVGGIAGASDVPIKICEAVVDIVCVNPSSGEAHYGGIAGESTHYITDCYTGGKLNMDTQKHTHNHVGRIVGNIGSTDWVKNCYSYMEDKTHHEDNTDIEFNDVDGAKTVNKSPRTYVTSAKTENGTKYKYEPKLYDAKVGKNDHEHYGYFK